MIGLELSQRFSCFSSVQKKCKVSPELRVRGINLCSEIVPESASQGVKDRTGLEEQAAARLILSLPAAQCGKARSHRFDGDVHRQQSLNVAFGKVPHQAVAASIFSVSTPSSRMAAAAFAASNLPSRASRDKRRGGDRFRVILEVPAQILAIVAAAEAVGAQRDQAARQATARSDPAPPSCSRWPR